MLYLTSTPLTFSFISSFVLNSSVNNVPTPVTCFDAATPVIKPVRLYPFLTQSMPIA